MGGFTREPWAPTDSWGRGLQPYLLRPCGVGSELLGTGGGPDSSLAAHVGRATNTCSVRVWPLEGARKTERNADVRCIIPTATSPARLLATLEPFPPT